MATARIGITTKNTTASSSDMTDAKTSPMTRITGPRTSGRVPETRAFWITVTSVVRRVTSDDVSKSSRLAKEKPCRCSYSTSRRLAPSPMAERAEKRA